MTLSPQEFAQKANLIKAKIDSAQNILITIHRSPDTDSIGCALAMHDILRSIGKKTTVICPEPPPQRYDKLKDFSQIVSSDYPSFPFNNFDLLLLLDTPPQQFSLPSGQIPLPDIPLAVIDHHQESQVINIQEKIVDVDLASCAQLVYQFVKLVGLPINSSSATLLLAGVYGDSNGLKTDQTDAEIFSLVSDLIKDGADYQEVVSDIENNLTLSEINLLGTFAQNLKLEKEGILWGGVDFDTYNKFGCPQGFTGLAANKFLNTEKYSKFGFIVVEKEPGLCQVNWRSKGTFDVARIARALGGGGHRNASAVRIASDFDQVVNLVLTKSKEFSQN